MDIKPLISLIVSSEETMLDRSIELSKERGYYEFTSQISEAWRLAIRGLSNSLVKVLEQSSEIPELSPHDDYRSGATGEFSILEARLHSDRGVSISMFLGLMKYFRQAYLEAALTDEFTEEQKHYFHKYINRFFDRVELGFVSAWTVSPDFSREP